jgi:hypothetical protein
MKEQQMRQTKKGNVVFVIVSVLFVCVALTGCLTQEYSDATATEGAVVGLRSLHLKGGVGAAKYDSSTDKDSRFSGNVDEEVIAGSVGGGIFVHKNVSVEASYVQFGDLDYKGTWQGTADRGSVETSGIEVGATGHWPIQNNCRPVNVLGRAGFFYWDSDESEVFGGVPSTLSDSGSGLFFGLGAETSISKTLDARFEWTHYLDVADDDMDALFFHLLFFPWR